MRSIQCVGLCCLLVTLSCSCSAEETVESPDQNNAEQEARDKKLNQQIVSLGEQLSALQKADVAQKEAISRLSKQVQELSEMTDEPVVQKPGQAQDIRAELAAEIQRLVELKYEQRTEATLLLARLGELNPFLQSNVIRIARNIQDGKELSLRDINILKEAGVGHEIIVDYYAKKGEKVSGAKVFNEVFGPKKPDDQKNE